VKKSWFLVAWICSFTLFFLSVIVITWSLSYTKVYKGVIVEGVDCSGYSPQQVTDLLSVWKTEYQDKQIVLYYGDKVFQVAGENIGFEVDVDSTLNDVWYYGRTGLWWQRIYQIWMGMRNGYSARLHIKYDEVKFDHLIHEWQQTIEYPAHNATFSIVTDEMIHEQQGRRLELEAIRPIVLDAFIQTTHDAIALPVIAIEPEITDATMAAAGIEHVLSLYVTTFNGEDKNRTDNIKVAAEKANGQILYPGQLFSFNETVGPRETMYGFKEALEISNGEFVMGIGGGICQLSSTLYNAALLANLNIVERHNHSKPLSYVPLGRDATVVFGGLDFKFTNNTPSPLMITTEISGNQLRVGIVGQAHSTDVVEIMSIEEKTIPPTIIRQQDNSLYLGEFKIDKQGKPGYTVTTVRILRAHGQEYKREVLSIDQYLADDTVIKIGTQLPNFRENES